MSGMTGLYCKFKSKFDQTPSDVSMNKRLGSYLIDWTLGGIFCGFPAVLLYGGVTGKTDMFSNLYIFEALGFERYWGIIAGLLCLLFALFYYVYVPWKIYPGQTLGKKWLHVKIVTVEGKQAGLKELLLRQAFTLFLLEGGVLVINGYLQQLITLITRFYVEGIWRYVGMVFTVISVLLVIYTASHRALHDYIAKTKVVLAPAIQISENVIDVEAKTIKQEKKINEPVNKTVNEKKRLPKKSGTKK